MHVDRQIDLLGCRVRFSACPGWTVLPDASITHCPAACFAVCVDLLFDAWAQGTRSQLNQAVDSVPFVTRFKFMGGRDGPRKMFRWRRVAALCRASTKFGGAGSYSGGLKVACFVHRHSKASPCRINSNEVCPFPCP